MKRRRQGDYVRLGEANEKKTEDGGIANWDPMLFEIKNY